MSQITYRKATAEDVARITELVESAGLPARHIDEFIDGFVLCERDGVIVACGGLEIYSDTGVLRSLVVVPEAQKLGIGREIVALLMDEAARGGVRDVYLFTIGAWEFWQRLGFSDIEMSDWRLPARSCWQYQRVSEDWERFQSMGIHTMWKNGDQRHAINSR